MKSLDKPVPPGGTIGIIGGGQLGRMLALAAARLGLKTCIYNDAPDAPAFQVTDSALAAPYDDLAMLASFAERCDAVTFEFENLPAHAIAHLAERVPVRPGAHALAMTQDRLTEKTFVEKLGLKVAPFFDVTSADQARDAFGKLNSKGILKTRRFGYDGKGQRVFRKGDDPAGAYESLGSVPLILESFVAFEREISVIAARGTDGSGKQAAQSTRVVADFEHDGRLHDLTQNDSKRRCGFLYKAATAQNYGDKRPHGRLLVVAANRLTAL